jgi:hypothetical protein
MGTSHAGSLESALSQLLPVILDACRRGLPSALHFPLGPGQRTTYPRRNSHWAFRKHFVERKIEYPPPLKRGEIVNSEFDEVKTTTSP